MEPGYQKRRKKKSVSPVLKLYLVVSVVLSVLADLFLQDPARGKSPGSCSKPESGRYRQ